MLIEGMWFRVCWGVNKNSTDYGSINTIYILIQILPFTKLFSICCFLVMWFRTGLIENIFHRFQNILPIFRQTAWCTFHIPVRVNNFQDALLPLLIQNRKTIPSLLMLSLATNQKLGEGVGVAECSIIFREGARKKKEKKPCQAIVFTSCI